MRQEDAEHLNVLSIFHFVLAGIAALFSCIPLLHLFLGILMVSGKLPADEPGGEQVVRMVGSFFIVGAIVAIVLGLAFALLILLTGFYLRRREHYSFCLVMAGVACLFIPFGTVLGIFSILVLLRPSVKEAFGQSPVKTS